MAKIQVDSHPHIHSGNSAHKYMFDLPITTYPMAVVAVLIQFIFATTILGASFADGLIVALRAALVLFTGVFSCIAAESIWWYFVGKKYNDFAGWFRIMATTYPSITGMLYALALPIGTPLYVVLIGGFVATIVGKTIFGGVGQNIFNPALVGRAFITIAFASLIGGAVNYTEVFPNIFGSSTDAIASASPLGSLNEGLLSYSSFKAIYGSFWKLFLGLYPSALGESLSFWIIGAFIYLSIKKTINWFVPVIYVGLVFVMSWAVALMTGLSTGDGLGTLAIYFPLFQVLSGGLLFGAVFMATEPVTSPITNRGRAVFAVYAAIITFAIRMLGNAPEGVMYAILLMNMFSPLIDNAFMGQRKGTSVKEIVFWIVTVALIVIITIYAGFRLGGSF
ncbi:MAG: putative NADH:ubiquinone oxidoreductase, subunit RnfD [Haloplasmataceae bacterium]|jgi:electron transport complex protein RnfD|nr:putative NADH:ubiquinone oxidoreductase, subunit RnfD [Haloplasmataceae bacterium]